MKITVYYLIIINVLAFILFGLDKHKARHNKWRIPEAELFAAAIAGGSAGAWAGMIFFHHKTRKKKFSVGIPVILILQVLLFWLAISGFKTLRG